MWTATTCCDGVSVCSTQGFTGVFTLWTSHRHGDQDWPSALWSMPSDHISCKMAQNWMLYTACENSCIMLQTRLWEFVEIGSPLFDTLNCHATYRNLMRPWGAVFVVWQSHVALFEGFCFCNRMFNCEYLSSEATAHSEILVRFLWCFIICILLMCFQKYQLPDGMWSGKEQPACELQLLLFSVFSTLSVSLSLLVSLSLSLSLCVYLSVPL